MNDVYLIMTKDLEFVSEGTLDQIDNCFGLHSDPTEDDLLAFVEQQGFVAYKRMGVLDR